VDASKFDGDLETAWNSGEISVLVVDQRSMGHGLNMQEGGRVIVWFSPNHSRELYDQMNARVARKGQKKQPLIYRLICPDTIDEAVIETLRCRGEAQGEMLALLNNLRLLRA
jgi:SNF2 family DNA or RNA helicase